MTTYKEAGVDVEKKNELLKKIKGHLTSTIVTPGRVLVSNTLFKTLLVNASTLKSYKEPMLAFNVDGAGTKTIIAAMAGRWEGIGHDIVNHCINDIVTMGAEPLYFCDYIASDKLKPEVIEEIVKSVAEACGRQGLIIFSGGETAEMPSVYNEGQTDVAGFIVGAVDKDNVIDGKGIKEGDVLIGLASTGLHTNGFSLARKVLFDNRKHNINDVVPPLNAPLGHTLLTVHRSYYRITNDLKRKLFFLEKSHGTRVIKGIAHITGGSFKKNLPRILPKGLGAEIDRKSWRPLPIFEVIQKEGDVPTDEMYNTFNMGVGYVYIVDKKHADSVVELLRELEQGYIKDSYQFEEDYHSNSGFYNNERVWKIGKVVKGEGVTYVD